MLASVALVCYLQAAPSSVTASTAGVVVDAETGAVAFPTGCQLVQTFTAATRAATVPISAGQVGWETDSGTIYRATATTAGAWSATSGGGGGSVSSATTSAEGVVELATTAETLAGTDTTRALTAAGVAGMLSDTDSGFKISSNGAGGLKLELWNNDQGQYQEVRLGGDAGEEHFIIAE